MSTISRLMIHALDFISRRKNSRDYTLEQRLIGENCVRVENAIRSTLTFVHELD